MECGGKRSATPPWALVAADVRAATSGLIHRPEVGPELARKSGR